MTYELFVALISFAAVSLISPGPNNLMLLASGMNYGWYKTLPHMLGIALGFPLMILLVGLGIAEIFDVIPYSYEALKIISAGYLLYLAYKIATATPISSGNVQSGSRPLSFLQAAAFQWVNPKAWAMALGAVAAYSSQSSPILSVILITSVFALFGAVTVNLWTYLGQSLQQLLQTPTIYRAFNIGCALILVATLYPILTGV